jgi:S-(hydroxymethyl)mycothiol dehydrogenase
MSADPYEGAEGADAVVEAVGRADTWKQPFYAHHVPRTLVLVVPPPAMKLPEIPLIDVFVRGGTPKPSWCGDAVPSGGFPALVDPYQQNRLDLDAFVTEEIGIGDDDAAISLADESPTKCGPHGRH